MQTLTAISAEPENKVIFKCEGANWICFVPWQDIYDTFNKAEIIQDVSARSLNYLFFNSSNEKLEVKKLDDEDPKLGALLFIYVNDKNKGELLPTWIVLKNYCSRTKLGEDYLKVLQIALAKESK